ncbi:TetR/AcrR family transcriptional regulator [Brevibacterium oceani]|uniref:TetR/AcrR family transcriptional regulator n=1 Tax=Brevibacterium oceani TaxID=358099 RepID=UPI001B328091|nr:TetR/AcrR family transcriptional regulator [Brevibacterium oceani]
MDLSPSGERILQTATALFYAEGVNAIGVDRIVAESGVSKPTLYAQFGSKSGLIAEVLRRRRETSESGIAEVLATSASSPGGRVFALFDWFVEDHAKPGFRGCRHTLDVHLTSRFTSHNARQNITKPRRLDDRSTRRRTHAPHGVHRPAGEDRSAHPP